MPKIVIENHLTFYAESNKSLLDSIEEQYLEIDYNCRGGFCGVCKATLLSGEVDYMQPPVCDLGEREVLTCCSRPKSDITLEFAQKLNTIPPRIGGVVE